MLMLHESYYIGVCYKPHDSLGHYGPYGSLFSLGLLSYDQNVSKNVSHNDNYPY